MQCSGPLLFSLCVLCFGVICEDVKYIRRLGNFLPSRKPDLSNAVFTPIDNKQDGATEVATAPPWIAQVKHVAPNATNALDLVMCTAVCVKDHIFITASRCLVTLRLPYTVVVYQEEELKSKAFVEPDINTKQMFDDISFIVTVNSAEEKSWKPIETFNAAIPFSYSLQGFAWFKRYLDSVDGEYNVIGFVSDFGTETPEKEHSGRYKIQARGEEAKNYDFTAARTNIKTTNIIESIGHLVKSCLGGGVVGIHEAYKGCGLLSALGLNLLLGIFVGYCMNMLVRNAQILYGRLQVPTMSYPDVAEATLLVGPFKKMRRFARPFRYAVDATIGIDLFGSCCVYAVIIARSIKQLLEESNVFHYIYIRTLIACLIIPCILICMITALKYLAPFSIVADIFIVTVAIATIYYGSKAATLSPLKFPLIKTMEGFLEFVGVCVFSMEGVGVSMPIENHMAEPKKFPIVLFGGMGIVVGIVMIVGFFGYWGYGDAALSPVTLNFPWAVFPIILKVFMALMIYVTFALNFWVPFDLIWFYLKKRHPQNKWWFWERVYRAIMVTLIITIAIIFPNVGSFMGFLGCFCLSLMGFIFPSFIELCVIWEDPGLGFMKWRLIRCIVICTFGIALCILGTYTNVKGMVKSAVDAGQGPDEIINADKPENPF